MSILDYRAVEALCMLAIGYLSGYFIGAWLRDRRLRRELIHWGGNRFAERFFSERGQDDTVR